MSNTPPHYSAESTSGGNRKYDGQDGEEGERLWNEFEVDRWMDGMWIYDTDMCTQYCQTIQGLIVEDIPTHSCIHNTIVQSEWIRWGMNTGIFRIRWRWTNEDMRRDYKQEGQCWRRRCCRHSLGRSVISIRCSKWVHTLLYTSILQILYHNLRISSNDASRLRDQTTVSPETIAALHLFQQVWHHHLLYTSQALSHHPSSSPARDRPDLNSFLLNQVARHRKRGRSPPSPNYLSKKSKKSGFWVDCTVLQSMGNCVYVIDVNTVQL